VPVKKKPRSATLITTQPQAGAPGTTQSKAKRAAPSTAAKPAAAKPAAAGKPTLAPKPKTPGAGRAAGAPSSLKSVILGALVDMKALEVKVLDVRGLTDIADFMVIASGTSDRHVRSVAQRVVEKTKEAGFRPHGVEGQQDSDWVLIDLHEMIVHVMLPRVREFYGLEKLWDVTGATRVARA